MNKRKPVQKKSPNSSNYNAVKNNLIKNATRRNAIVQIRRELKNSGLTVAEKKKLEKLLEQISKK